MLNTKIIAQLKKLSPVTILNNKSCNINRAYKKVIAAHDVQIIYDVILALFFYVKLAMP